MAVAIVLGIVVGVVALVPLYGGIRLSRRVTVDDQPGGKFGFMGLALGCVFVSFVVLLVAAIVCIKTARGLVLPFVGAEALTVVVVAIGFAISRFVRR